MPCLFLPAGSGSGFVLPALLAVVALSAWQAWRVQRRWHGWRLIADRLGCLTLLPPDAGMQGLGPVPLSHAIDSGFALWLYWQHPSPGRGRAGLLLLPDQMQADEWRALRLWLRQRATHSAPDGL